jgi:membrane protease YdiL (CAAX protease family)
MTAPTTTTATASTRAVVVPLGVLVALGLLRTVLLLSTDGLSYLGFRLSGSDQPLTYALLGSNVWIVLVDLVTVLLVARLLVQERSSLRRLLDPKPLGRTAAWGLLAFVILMVAFLAATFVGNLVVYQGPPPTTVGSLRVPLWYGLWSIVVMPLTVAVAEESLYRGYLQPRLQARFGRVAGVVVVALLFSLQHVAFSLGSWDGVAARVIATFLSGLAFGALYMWLKRLAPLVVAHWLIDVLGLGLPMLLAAVS